MNFRPHVIEFLQQLSQACEVIVFTASHQLYADAILNHLDKDKKLIHHRLYRQNCIQYGDAGNVYIKDLRVLEKRELKNVLIVDNAPYSFASQIENGYPIIPFYDNKADNELLVLLDYIKTLVVSDDVRSNNRAKFRLKEVTDTNICEYAQYYQHTNSDVSGTEQSNESLPSCGDESPTPGLYEKVKAPLKNLQAQLAEMYKSKPK